ncbi:MULTISPECIES: halocyanin domain-containing protein [Halorussus]|uniref:halocyanin domain-containing protein n=1 Tax=Halorussus TaxID=1070314 RepID=UPI00209FAA84|nr:halocyanin domain-containing protein [Halorussus vallis]USZ73993.1 halocyanin domain-containing protein [Halorussus vallis]
MALDADALDRRTVLKLTGAAAVTTALAGCSGDGGSAGSDSNGGGDGEDGGNGGGDGSTDFGGWFDGVGNFDGVVDRTGSDEVTVKVGTRANGAAYGFGPAAVKVSPGTTVVWKWTGDGGSHNVVAKGGGFESKYHTKSGATFEHTFESAGTYEYYCLPHKTMGMKGAIVVE